MPYILRTQRMTTDPDTDLVLRFARTRDASALEPLLARHWSIAHALARRLTGDPAAADDVAQQAFLDVIDHAGRLDARRAFGPWFRTLVLNRARKHARAQDRRRAHEERAPRPEAHASDPLDAARVADGVARLPEDVREPLVLHFYEGLSHAEVADALGCPKGTAASRIRRGLEQLQSVLAAAGCAVSPTALEALLARPPRVAPTSPPAARTLLRGARRPRALPAALLATLTALAALAAVVIVAAAVAPDAPPAPAPPAPAPAVEPASPAPESTRSTPTAPPAPPATTEAPVAAPAEAREEQVAPRQSSRVEVDPTAAARGALTVRLVDDLGQPLPGLPVRIVRVEAGVMLEEPVVDAVADERGEVRLGLPADVDHALSARPREGSEDDDPWAARWYGRADAAPQPDQLLRVRADEALVVTRVLPRRALITLDLTNALAGARVKISIDGAGSMVFTSEGPRVQRRFRVAPGEHEVLVQGGGRADLRLSLDLAPGANEVVTRALDWPAARLSGVVVDTSGRAVRDAVVRAGLERAVTGPSGAFELRLAPGVVKVRVEAAGHLTTEVEATATEQPSSLRLALVPAGLLEVRVVDGDGRPAGVARVALAVRPDGTPGFEHFDMPDPPVGSLSSWQGDDAGAWTLAGETDEQGRLVLDRLPAGEYTILARGRTAKVTTRAGETTLVELGR